MSGSVLQSGAVTAGHLVTWATNGVIQDGSTQGTGQLGQIQIFNAGPSDQFSVQTANAPTPYTYFGINAASSGIITLTAKQVGTNPSAASLVFNINGTSYPFPGGYGNVDGPMTTVVGDAVLWNSTTGTLIKDGGGPAFMGLSGGVGTPGNIVHAGGVAALPPEMTITRQNSYYGDTGILNLTYYINDDNGPNPAQLYFAGGGFWNVNTSNIHNPNTGAFVNGPTTSGIALLLGQNTTSAANTTFGSGQYNAYIGLWVNSQKNLDSTFTPSTSQGYSGIWGHIVNLYDKTGLPTSLGGVTTNEWDMAANNLDDKNTQQRNGLNLVITNWTNPGALVVPCEWSAAMSIFSVGGTGSTAGTVKSMFKVDGNYSNAGLDLRRAQPIFATITQSLGAPSTTLQVDNVLPFVSNNEDFSAISPNNTKTVWINGNGNKYQVSGYALANPVNGGSGTITTTTPVSTSDGTAGNTVNIDCAAIWLGDGQAISMTLYGNNWLYWNNSLGALSIGDPQNYMAISRFGISAVGPSGSSVGLFINSQGSGDIYLGNGSGSVIIQGPTVPANTILMGGGGTGSPCRIIAQGTDTNVGLSIQSQANGLISFTGPVQIQNNVGFFDATPVSKPTVTGSKASNAALTSLMNALATLGLVVNSTS